MYDNIDKRVGKKVWVFEKNGWDEELNTSREWLVESINEPCGNFYDYHFIISDGDEKRDVMWFETVVVPEENEDEGLRIEKYLSGNGFYFDYIEEDEILDTPIFLVEVSWGDWKHEHGWLDSLMGHIGYELLQENVTEEDGSDCYSSVHVFIKKDAECLPMLKAAKELFR